MRPTSEVLNLLDLPNELLNQILKNPHLAPVDIFALARTSRSLNSLLLPTLLPSDISTESTKVTLPALNQQAPGSVSVLAVLSVAFDFTSITHICCNFDRHLDNIYHQLRGLLCLASRLSSIQEVELLFSTSEAHHSTRGTDTQLAEWSKLFANVMNAVVEKGCVVLAVKNGVVMTQAFSLQEQTTKKPTSATAGFLARFGKREPAAKRDDSPLTPLGGRGWTYSRPQYQGVKSTLAHLSSLAERSCGSLTKLQMCTNILILPPCSNWTVNLIMHATALTDITIANITISYEAWSHFLPLLAQALATTGCLRYFTMEDCNNVPVPALLKYLGEIPFIHHLSLDYSLHFVSLLSADLPSKVPNFPHLTRLRAPADYISFLLSAQISRSVAASQSQAPLPALQHLCILPRTNYFSYFDFHESSAPPIISRFTDRPTLTIGMDIRVNSPTSFQVIPRPHGNNPKKPKSSAMWKAFRRVNEVTVSCGTPYNIQPEAFGRWLKGFEEVRAVTLTRSFGWLGAQETRMFLSGIWEHCPGVMDFMIDGKEVLAGGEVRMEG